MLLRPLAAVMSDVPWCHCEDAAAASETTTSIGVGGDLGGLCSLIFPDFESAVLESFVAVSYGEVSFDDVPAKHRDEI